MRNRVFVDVAEVKLQSLNIDEGKATNAVLNQHTFSEFLNGITYNF